MPVFGLLFSICLNNTISICIYTTW